MLVQRAEVEGAMVVEATDVDVHVQSGVRHTGGREPPVSPPNRAFRRLASDRVQEQARLEALEGARLQAIEDQKQAKARVLARQREDELLSAPLASLQQNS